MLFFFFTILRESDDSCITIFLVVFKQPKLLRRVERQMSQSPTHRRRQSVSVLTESDCSCQKGAEWSRRRQAVNESQRESYDDTGNGVARLERVLYG